MPRLFTCITCLLVCLVESLVLRRFSGVSCTHNRFIGERRQIPLCLHKAPKYSTINENRIVENEIIHSDLEAELSKLLVSTAEDGFISSFKENFTNDSVVSLQSFQFSERKVSDRVRELLNRPAQVDQESFSDLISLTQGMNSKGKGIDDTTERKIDLFSSHIPNVPLSSVAAAHLQHQKDVKSSADYAADRIKLNALLDELKNANPQIHHLILEGFRDLLLSDSLLGLMREANAAVADLEERMLYRKIVDRAAQLVTEFAELVQSETARHLKTVQEVCAVAAQCQHDPPEFFRRMNELKPRFDTDLLLFLRHERVQEAARVAETGCSPTHWLHVVTVIEQAVQAEFEARHRSALEALLLAVRFDRSHHSLRENIFRRFVAITPAMELPYLRALATNMVESVGGMTDSEMVAAFPDAGMRDRVSQQMRNLRVDVDKYLSEEVVQTRMKAFELEVQKGGQRLFIQHRNPHHQQPQKINEISGGSALSMNV